MVRMAVATMVWSRAARNMPIIRPTRIVMICRWVRGPSGRAGAAAAMSVLHGGVGRGGRVAGRVGCGLVVRGAAAAQVAARGRSPARRRTARGGRRTSLASSGVQSSSSVAEPLGRAAADAGRARASPSSLSWTTCARPSSGSLTLSTRPCATRVLTCRLTVETSECTTLGEDRDAARLVGEGEQDRVGGGVDRRVDPRGVLAHRLAGA